MWALVPEVVAYGELKSGKRNTAIINAIMGLFFKVGYTIGGAVPLWFLAAYGFNQTAVSQTPKALSGITLTAIWLPILIAILAALIIQAYPISDKELVRINSELDKKRVQHK